MDLEAFVKNWGYLAVFLGAAVEGETVMFIASTLAYSGILDLKKVIFTAFLGTALSEQFLYMVGLKYGKYLIESRFLQNKFSYIERILGLLKLYDIYFILFCRFIWGIRSLSPFVVGVAEVPFVRFFIFNLLAAAIWSVISCGGFFLLNSYLKIDIYKILDNVYAQYGLVFLVIFLVIYFFLKLFRDYGRKG